MIKLFLTNRIAQIAISILFTAVFVGGYGWITKAKMQAEHNKQIQVLQDLAEDKAQAREAANDKLQGGQDAIESGDFVEYFNSNN